MHNIMDQKSGEEGLLELQASVKKQQQTNNKKNKKHFRFLETLSTAEIQHTGISLSPAR